MDPVTLIVAALAAGVSAGVTQTASSAVRDAYTGLREVVRRRLTRELGPEVGQVAIEGYEADPTGGAPRLERLIAAVDAGQDAEIVAAARQLLELADPAGTAAGKYGTVDLRGADLRGATQFVVGNGNVQVNNPAR